MTIGDRSRPAAVMVPTLIVLVAVAILNFLSFVAISHRLGGDALNGKIENGHYYLASHGRFTEVSANVFAYSRFHTLSLFVTHLIGMCAMGGLVWKMRAYFPSKPARR